MLPGIVLMRVQTQARQTAPGNIRRQYIIRRQFFGEFHFLCPGGRVYPGGHRHGLRYRPPARMGINSFIPLLPRTGMYSISLWTESVTKNNVYFLNGVTESDLMALAEKSDGKDERDPGRGCLYLHGKVCCRGSQYLLPGLQE